MTDKNSHTFTPSGTQLQPEQAIPETNHNGVLIHHVLASPTRTAQSLGQMRKAGFLRKNLGFVVTRTQLIVTGQHVELTTLAEQAGFAVRVFFQKEVYERILENANAYRSESGDLFESMFAMREAIKRAPLRDCPTLFQVGELTLAVRIGKTDHDDNRPALTVFLAEEEK